MFKLLATAAIVATLASPSLAAEPPTCDNIDVQNIVLRVAKKHSVFNNFTREIGLVNGKRWCTAVASYSGAEDSAKLTYTVELINAETGRFWMQIISNYNCFILTAETKHWLEVNGMANLICK
jgi:hypothetical protein